MTDTSWYACRACNVQFHPSLMWSHATSCREPKKWERVPPPTEEVKP